MHSVVTKLKSPFVLLATAALCLAIPSNAHQTVEQHNDYEVGLAVTAEVLSPYGEDGATWAGIHEIESFHSATLGIHSTSTYDGMFADLTGDLPGNPTVAHPGMVLHVVKDDPETPEAENDTWQAFGLRTNFNINIGANTVRANSEAATRDYIVILSTNDTHTITGQESM